MRALGASLQRCTLSSNPVAMATMVSGAVRVGVRTVHSLKIGQTLVEKIAQRHAVRLAPGQVVRAGDFVTVSPAFVMTHDNTAAVMDKYGLNQHLRCG